MEKKVLGGGYTLGEDDQTTDNFTELVGATPLGDINYNSDTGEVTAEKSKGINVKFGGILTFELDLEVFVSGKATLKK